MSDIWNDLPESIRALQKYADEYGVLQFDDAIYESISKLNKSKINELKKVGILLSTNWDAIQEYISQHPITQSESGKRLYFLLRYFAHGNDLSVL